MLDAAELAVVDAPSESLTALVEEVAADAGFPLASAVAADMRQARLTVTANNPDLAAQGYRLEIVPTTTGADVSIRARDEAGAFYGLVSLAQLVASDGDGWWVRAATVEDAPGFARRGAILDPAPLTGA
jgi:N-acetyl-beta-hexosaminidase